MVWDFKLMQEKSKIICIIDLGGTISYVANNQTSEFYQSSYKGLESILHEISLDITIDVEHFSKVISHDLTIDNLIELAQRLKYLLSLNKYHGIVVSMGTNALEDTAYFINLAVQSKQPIVFTGAHYPQQSLGFDGARNLYNALKIASSQKALELGVLVTFYDYVVTARDAVKHHAGLPNNFTNNNVGIIGHIIGGKFIVKLKPIVNNIYLHEFNINKIKSLPKVVIVYGHIGMSNMIVETAISANIDGIVSAGFGKGYQPEVVTTSLKKAAGNGITVVRCARNSPGYTHEDPKYDIENGFIYSSGLSAQKSSMLLSVALSITRDTAKLKKIFAEA
jgi:L-asparaginase